MSEVHRILKRQLRRATRADGSLDVETLLAAVSRTYQDNETETRRTARAMSRMLAELRLSNADLARARDQLSATLNAIRHGIVVVDGAGQVQLCNRRACEILGLPQDFASGGHSLNEVLGALGGEPVEHGEFAGTAVIALPGARFAEIHIAHMAHHSRVILVEDITLERQRERDRRQAENEYRSLFDNSVYGIYRDTLDGRPVRVNPALAAFNGYASEAEQIAAVQARTGSWYVDPRRSRDFQTILQRDGRVHDLVSEVYRHRTGERVWITENAWYVRDAEGRPLFIEGTIQDATERITAQTAMTRLADYDQLTDATSRYRFMESLTEAVAHPDRPFALYCVDLDMFKDVNDSLGHGAGDLVLKVVADRLQALADRDDMVARLGGDEFALLSHASGTLADPAKLAAAIVAAVRQPARVEAADIQVGASVGIVLFPEHGTSAPELLKSGDMALYEAKAKGRNRWRLFDHELREGIEKRKTIETELRASLDRNELDLIYQPIVTSATGDIVGFEALMRFNHPTLGPIAPAEFIPIAEQAGLMTAIGARAISRACEAASILQGAVLNVNVSANQFRWQGLLAHIQQELARFRIAPSRLVLEITETALMSNESAAYSLLSSLRELGIGIAIDDFGTGYSSLGYLRRMPITMVKIDRSFVSGIGDQKANLSIIRAILGIGRDLGLQVVAEGVETAEQRLTLIAEGCRLMQGHLFAPAHPLAEAAADLALGPLPAPLSRLASSAGPSARAKA